MSGPASVHYTTDYSKQTVELGDTVNRQTCTVVVQMLFLFFFLFFCFIKLKNDVRRAVHFKAALNMVES